MENESKTTNVGGFLRNGRPTAVICCSYHKYNRMACLRREKSWIWGEQTMKMTSTAENNGKCAKAIFSILTTVVAFASRLMDEFTDGLSKKGGGSRQISVEWPKSWFFVTQRKKTRSEKSIIFRKISQVHPLHCPPESWQLQNVNWFWVAMGSN